MKLQLHKAFGRETSVSEHIRPAEAKDQREMSEHLRMLAHAVMQTDDAVMITTVFGIIQFVNPAFERYTGYCAQEAVGRTPALVKSGEHPSVFFAELWKTVRNGKVFRAVFTNRHKSGKIYYEEKTITPIRDAGEEITHFVSTGRDVSSRVLAEARLDYLAHYDVLTQLPNRRLFMTRLDLAISRCQRDSTKFALLFIDLDRFKRINDALGNAAGDKMLAKVASRLCEIAHVPGSVARLGGDEFTIIFESSKSLKTGSQLAEALIAAFADPFEIEDRELFTGISIGIAAYPDDGEDIESLIRHADIAMHQAKSQGRSTYVNFSPVMEGGTPEDLSIEASLRSALKNAEFEVYYQPIVRPGDQRIVAVEALLRWHSPQHGEVPPSRFITMLEETGLIAPVGRWVLETACAEIKALEQPGFEPVILAVNISGRQFRDGKLINDVRHILQTTGLAAAQLELEITESVLIEDASAAGKTLVELAALGVRLAIDDFGTGYSSLSYLRRFPINTLKIDRSFVTEMESSPDAVAIVKTIISLADNLGLEIVAEGVETAGQLALLSAFGCAKLQGYLFSRPLPLAGFSRLLNPPGAGYVTEMAGSGEEALKLVVR